MVHIASRSPLSTTIATLAAGAVVLAPMTVGPPKQLRELTVPTISIQTVDLTALARPLRDARGAEVSAAATRVLDVAQDIPTAIAEGLTGLISSPIQGAAAGIFFGFIGGGILAGNLLSWVPEPLYPLVTPIIQASAVIGALIGAPIGAVVGPIVYTATLLSGILSPPSAVAAASARVPAASGRNTTTTASARISAASGRDTTAKASRASAASGRAATTTPRRTTQPGVLPHRSLAKPSAATASEDAASASKEPVPQHRSQSGRNGAGHTRAAASNSPAPH